MLAMKVATIIARVLLGLVFVVFGSNIFLHFIPMPPPPPRATGSTSQGAFPEPLPSRRRHVQMVGGLLLLDRTLCSSRFGILAPVIVNI